MDRLSNTNSLVVSQIKEWGEILTGFETLNKYSVTDDSGNALYFAAEEKGSLLARLFLRAYRPFTMVVLAQGGEEILRIKRPFRFFFHRAEVFDSQGKSLGVIERQFAILRRIYSIRAASNDEEIQLFGPILHPWTFNINKGEKEYGKITKKWGGLMKEGFTDADTFGVMLPSDWDVSLKALLLGAVFLIDFVHFENKN